jgi:DNA repair exonuclease SbcCD ATPase subunit
MKKIVLERLTLRNFKGFKEFTLDTNGGNTDAYGDNGTGKTTLFDGFVWLLFGKDSANRSEKLFEIKPLDITGNVKQHKLKHEVEADLLIDGRRKTLRRVYSEKWTKKRGSVVDSFTGNTTDFYIDSVPVKEKEYQVEIDSLIKEDLFKLLTSPSFFNEKLKMEERRKVLLEICGDITDAEVIHSNPALHKLISILGDTDVESHKRKVTSQCREINKEIQELPVRISEAQRNQPDISELDEEMLQEDIDTLRSQIQSKENELSRIQHGGETAVKEKRIREIEAELLDLQNRLQSETLDKVAIKRDEVNKLHAQVDSLRRKIDDNQHRIRQNELTINSRNQEAERLRTKWTETNSQVFENHHDTNCPTCGQGLPEDQIQAAHDKALADFNRGKAHRLEQISNEGKQAKEQVTQAEQANIRLQGEIEQLTEQLNSMQSMLTFAEFELTELRSGIQSLDSNPDYQGLIAGKEAARQAISKIQSSQQEACSKVRTEISSIQQELRSLEEELAKFAQYRKIEKRIDELESEERKLAAEYERLQEELFLTEEFTRAKVALLDSKINSKFKHARFRLFKDLVNGGVDEVCDTLYNGVPYGGGLNNAARINVGLDIINTLGRHYGFSAPIFIDNAESVTDLIDTDSQMIRLIVPPTFDSLPKEVQKELAKQYDGYEEAQAAWRERNKKLRLEHNDIQEAI